MIWCLGQDVEFDLSVPDHCFFIFFDQNQNQNDMHKLSKLVRILIRHIFKV